jgi:hypothetical protein
MSRIISCLSCARRLSVGQAAAAEQMFKCPACQAVFAIPADDKSDGHDDANDRPRAVRADGFGNGGFSENPLPAGRPRRDLNADDQTERSSSWPDDADDDWPDYDRPVKKTKRRRGLVLPLCGFALLVVVGATVYFFTSEPDVTGTWRGTFRFAGVSIDCKYQFRPDGTFVDEHIEPGRGMKAFRGRYKQENGRVTIHWAGDGVEIGSVRRTGLNTIEYVVLDHSEDFRQIGCRVTFRRIGR